MAQFNEGDAYGSIRGVINDTGIRKNNFAAVSAPNISQDTTQGYEVGSLWLDVITSKLYYATSVATGNATWKEFGVPYGNSDVQTYLDAQGYSNVDNDNQTLTWTEGTLTLTISGGNSVALTGTFYTDSDVDSFLTTNGYSNTVVSYSNATVQSYLDVQGYSNTVVSYSNATVQSYLDAQGYSNVDLDAQTLTWDSGNSNLSISGGNTVTLTGLDAQTLILNDDGAGNLTVSGGNTVDLRQTQFLYDGLINLPDASTYHGAIAHVHAEAAMYFAHGGSWNRLANQSELTDSQTLTWDEANSNISISGGNTVTVTSAADDIIQDFVTLTIGSNTDIANVELAIANYRLSQDAVDYPNGRKGSPIIYVNVLPGNWVSEDYFSIENMSAEVRFQAPEGADARANTSLTFNGQMNINSGSKVRFDGLTLHWSNWLNQVDNSTVYIGRSTGCNVDLVYHSASNGCYFSTHNSTFNNWFYVDLYHQGRALIRNNDFNGAQTNFYAQNMSVIRIEQNTSGECNSDAANSFIYVEDNSALYIYDGTQKNATWGDIDVRNSSHLYHIKAGAGGTTSMLDILLRQQAMMTVERPTADAIDIKKVTLEEGSDFVAKNSVNLGVGNTGTDLTASENSKVVLGGNALGAEVDIVNDISINSGSELLVNISDLTTSSASPAITCTDDSSFTVSAFTAVSSNINVILNQSSTSSIANVKTIAGQVQVDNGISLSDGTMRLASLTTTDRNALTAANGDMIYNVTDGKLQGYQAGAWINLDGT